MLKDNIEKCENEKKRLELLVKSDETKHELETQITKLKEESDAKVQKVHECKVKQQEYKQRLAQFQKYLKELQHLTVKHETIQKTRQGKHITYYNNTGYLFNLDDCSMVLSIDTFDNLFYRN